MATVLNTTTATDRVAISLGEARREHGLSQRQLAELSGVSQHTIARVERGGHADAAKLVQLGITLLVLDAYRPPRLDGDLAAGLVTLAQPARVTLVQPRIPADGWAS